MYLYSVYEIYFCFSSHMYISFIIENNYIQIISGVTCWNPAFDVTPARLITGIITEKGIFRPSELSTLASQTKDLNNLLPQL